MPAFGQDRATAYIVACTWPNGHTRFAIFSEERPTILGRIILSTVGEFSANDYAEARRVAEAEFARRFPWAALEKR